MPPFRYPGARRIRPSNEDERGRRPALLVCPGWKDDDRAQYEHLREALVGHGWLCARANLPDASWSAARRARIDREASRLCADEDLRSLAAQPEVDPLSMGLLGFSYGGYIAALLAHERGAAWLVLRSPALYPDIDWRRPKEQFDDHALASYRKCFHGPRDNRALACCARFEGDVLLVSSQNDEVMPAAVMESYRQSFGRARSLTCEVLASADHALSAPDARQRYRELVVSWLLARRAACPKPASGAARETGKACLMLDGEAAPGNGTEPAA